jgi:hypothetical protein
MFAMGVLAFLIFLFRQNPKHLLDIKLALAFPALFFLIPFYASRFLRKVLIVTTFCIVCIIVGSIVGILYLHITSFKLNLPALELVVGAFTLTASSIAGTFLGYFISRRPTSSSDAPADGGNGA